MSAPEITTSPIDDLNIENFKYHPKIYYRLMEVLERQRMLLENGDKKQRKEARAMVKAVRMMLGLPDKILNEEREKAKGRS